MRTAFKEFIFNEREQTSMESSIKLTLGAGQSRGCMTCDGLGLKEASLNKAQEGVKRELYSQKEKVLTSAAQRLKLEQYN